MALRQLSCSRQQALPSLEVVGPFLALERGSVTGSGGMPADRKLGNSSGPILAA